MVYRHSRTLGKSEWAIPGGALERPAQGHLTRARASRAAAILAFYIVAFVAHAESRVSSYDVESAYLFNFGRFVRYSPSDAETRRKTFDICIVGEDPLGTALDDLTANERLDDKPVRVLRLKAATEARDCDIAYISASEGSHIGPDLEALGGSAALTVSDADDFLRRGGMIQFIVAGSHLRFSVNLDAVHKAHLGLSSRLLRVAVAVNGKPPEEAQP